jgi:hypothetical protein
MRVTGTPGSALPAAIEITAGGNNYITSGTVPSQITATGNVVLQIRALLPGPTPNATGGSVPTGQILTAITGVDTEVEICGGRFCGGADAEECEAFRSRYIERKQYHPRSNDTWIRRKLLEWPCVTRVCERTGSCCTCVEPCLNADCACRECGGDLHFYVMFDGTFDCGIAPSNIIADINTWLFGETPGYGQGQVDIGICGQLHVVMALPVYLIVDIEGCPTPSQQAEMTEQITDFFTTICPSQAVLSQQINVIVANIMGSSTNVSSRIEPVDPDQQGASTTPCGDLEPDCDYLPCLTDITFTGPTTTGIGGCS